MHSCSVETAMKKNGLGLSKQRNGKLLKKNNRVSGAGLEQGKKSARCVEHREVGGPETDDGEPDQERRERWLVRNSGSC